jgi:hypothetical protein
MIAMESSMISLEGGGFSGKLEVSHDGIVSKI